MMMYVNMSMSTVGSLLPTFDDAKVRAKKIPTQRYSELGMILGKWERYWENAFPFYAILSSFIKVTATISCF